MTIVPQSSLSSAPNPGRWRSLVAIAAVTVLALTSIAEAQAGAEGNDKVYWNQFRGPNGQGVMESGDIPVQFGPDTNVLWKIAMDEGQSSPVIWEDRIFVTSCSPIDKLELTTHCLDRGSGEVMWHRSVRASTAGRYYSMNGPASPTPAVDADHVYVYFGTYGLICYDHGGTKLWERRIAPPASQYGASVSPVLHGEKVILAADSNGGKSRLLAMHRDTGEPVWETARPLFGAGWSTPMIWHTSVGDELIVLGTTRLTSYDPDTGAERWWAGGFSTETIGVPVEGEGMLFVSDAPNGGRPEPAWDTDATWKITVDDFDDDRDGVIQRSEMNDGFRVPLRLDLEKNEPGAVYPVPPRQVDGWFRHLDVDGDGELSRNDWEEFMSGFATESNPIIMAILPGASLVQNARPESVEWELSRWAPEMPSPLYRDGKLYLLRDGGVLTCLKATSGDLLFRGRIGAMGQYVASPVVAGDKLITASKGGLVSVIQVADELRVLATNDFEEAILATPALAENRIYLRTAGHLYAIGE